MKRIKNYFGSAIMAMTAVALTGFTSCTRGDGQGPEGERPAILNIKLVNPALTRITGAAPTTSHSTITDVNIFVLDAGNDVGWSGYYTAGDLVANTAALRVTTGAKSVYAIANAGENLTDNYTKKEELETTIAQVGLVSQYTNLWATGSVDGSSWNFQEADSNNNGFMEQTVNLTLKFIAARITVTVKNEMHRYDGSEGSVRITDVAVLNARGESTLFGTSLIPASLTAAENKFIQGLANPIAPATPFNNFPASTDYTVEDANVDRLNNPYTFTNSSTPFYSYFYVFESDSDELTEFPTIVTLVGTDVDGNPTYFPVHLASYETWASNTLNYAGGVERGKSYNIEITLSADAKTGSGGGVPDPTVNVKNVDLMVKVSISDWTAVPLGKNF